MSQLHPSSHRGAPGFQLIEVTLALALLGFLALLIAPSLHRASARLRVDLAARELTAVMAEARSHAIRESVFVGLKFHLEGPRPRWGLYRDGDGDGLRSSDIADGTDPAVQPVRALQFVGARAGFGFQPGPPAADPSNPGQRLTDLDDPIRFGRSDIISFSTRGTSSTGTLYLTDGLDWQLAVRLQGSRGRPRIVTWYRAEEEWR